MRGVALLTVSMAIVVAGACGGKAVIDSNTGGSGTGTTTGTTGTGTTTTTPSGSCDRPGSDCPTVCEVLFCCADPLCADLGPEQKPNFLEGCIDTCESPDGAALKAVINGSDCSTTVNLIKAASSEFACVCDGSGPGCDNSGGAGTAGGGGI